MAPNAPVNFVACNRDDLRAIASAHGEEHEEADGPQPPELMWRDAEEAARKRPRRDERTAGRDECGRQGGRGGAVRSTPCVPQQRADQREHDHHGDDRSGERRDVGEIGLHTDERNAVDLRHECITERRPQPPRRKRHDCRHDARAEGPADRLLRRADRAHQTAEVAVASVQCLLDQRRRPKHEEHDGRHQRRAPHLPAKFGPAVGITTSPLPHRPRERTRAPDRQHGDEHRVTQMGLEYEARDADGKRQQCEIAARERPHEHDEEQERKQHRVRLPRIEQQLAPHGPREPRGHRHRGGARDRTAAAVGDDGDADDRGTVEQQHPDGEPG